MQSQTLGKLMSLERQQEHLLKVSRTFALTIPMLPKNLQDVIANAYLLCRIADTIEDDKSLNNENKIKWLNLFSDFFKSDLSDESTLKELLSMQSFIKDSANPYEFNLFKELDLCINRLLSFKKEEIYIVKKGVSILSSGMAYHLEHSVINTQDDLDTYCYYVAGVVGEFLAFLFINAKTTDDEKVLKDNAISFGLGLQLTNIIKDRYEDKERNVEFLTKEMLSKSSKLCDEICIAKGHLSDAISFIKAIHKKEKGLRAFCLLNVLMAIETLNLLAKNVDNKDKKNLKISRAKVRFLYIITKFICSNNFLIDLYYKKLCHNDYGKRRDVIALNNKLSKWN